VIELREVGKLYHGYLPPRTTRAVHDFSLTIERGEVLGIAGPNGAGKSTLIAMLLGFLRPTSGTVTIDGIAPRTFVERKGVSYMSELVAIPPRWTVEGALRRYGTLAGIAPRALGDAVERAIAALGLEEHRGKRAKALSKGNLQRLGLAQALMSEHEVVVLDEPTHGLDPVWTQRFRDLVQSLRRPERATLIASHNLDELERVADRVAIVDQGQLQRVVSMRGAGRVGVHRYRIVVAEGGDAVTRAFPGARTVTASEYEVDVADLRALNTALAQLIASGAVVASVAPAYSALEQQFRDAVRSEKS
jgi:ABC-type multidrug transport system ATPase subunit